MSIPLLRESFSIIETWAWRLGSSCLLSKLRNSKKVKLSGALWARGSMRDGQRSSEWGQHGGPCGQTLQGLCIYVLYEPLSLCVGRTCHLLLIIEMEKIIDVNLMITVDYIYEIAHILKILLHCWFRTCCRVLRRSMDRVHMTRSSRWPLGTQSDLLLTARKKTKTLVHKYQKIRGKFC